MPYNSQRVLYDGSGNNPIPQYYNQDQDKYEPNKGMAGGASSHALGTIAYDSWEGNANITKTFSKACVGLFLANDGTGDVIVSINSLSFKIKAGETFAMKFEPFTTLQITTSSAYRAIVGR